MVDKSNEYGYVGASPTQTEVANTGVFEVNDVVDLINTNQWYSGLVADELNLIYEYTFNGSESTVDITTNEIDPTVYDTLYVVGDISGTSMTAMSFVASEDDLATTYAGTNYGRQLTYSQTASSFTRSAVASQSSITEMTPAITGDCVFGYTITSLYNSNFSFHISGYAIGYDGSNAVMRYTSGNSGEVVLNSYRFSISNVDAGSTIKFYSYKAA